MRRRLLCVLSAWLVCLLLQGQQPVPLWPKAEGAAREVTITPYVVEGSRTAVVVCPGGSYFWLDYKGEGLEVAQWLQKHGVSAFVLKYRVPGWWAWYTHYRLVCRGVRHPDMYDDGQQALQWVVMHAAEYGIDTALIGMMGFSAGGHLVLSQAVTTTGRRPAFVAAIYPVVTMTGEYVHKRSRRGLLSEWGQYDKELRDQLSIERHIPSDCPPIFLVNCVDDPVVDYHNAQMLADTLSAKGISHRFLQYRRGRHGFGVSEVYGTPESRQWKYQFLQWLETVKMRIEN